MIRSNSFEGGVNGVAVTPGNSGGASGDAYNFVNGANWLYSNTHPGHGGMAMSASGAMGGGHVEWAGLGSLTTTVFIRYYVWLASLPTGAQHWGSCFAVTNAFTNSAFPIYFGLDGNLYTNDSTGAFAAPVGAYAINQLIRVEAAVLPHPSAGTLELRYFANPEDPINSWTLRQQRTGLNTGTDIDRYRIGDAGNPSTNVSGVWIDDIAVSDVTWLGPAAAGEVKVQVPSVPFW